MQYYKVYDEYDGTPKRDGSLLRAGELLTPSELAKYNVQSYMVRPVWISKSLVHWRYGSRWQDGKIEDIAQPDCMEKDFVTAYTWLFGEAVGKARKVYKNSTPEYRRAIMQVFKDNAKRSLWED